MREERLMRRLVYVEIVLVFAGLWISQVSGWMLPEPLNAWIQADEAARGRYDEWLQYGINAVLAGATVLSWIAILGLWRAGRTIYLATTVAWILLDLVTGPSVLSPIESALGSLIALNGGAILGLAYGSPLRVHFQRPQS